MTSELAFLPAMEQARLVREKEVSPVDLVETYASRIESIDPTINSFITTCLDRALDEAKRAADAPSEAPFHGVPITIKDLIDAAGVRSTHGAAAFAERVPETDDAVVRRIRSAGFIVLGKTNTPEFGTVPFTEPPAYGPCRNPWDTGRTPGGSSGGAAAGVAAGLTPVAHGTDGGGSIRIPASCCGVFGIKPSRGRVSRAPGPPSLLSTSGPIAHTVADAAALLDVMAGYETGDAYWMPAPGRPFVEEAKREPGKLRIAFSSVSPAAVEVAPGNLAALSEAAKLLAELGHDVEEAKPPWDEELAFNFGSAWFVITATHEPMPPVETLTPLNQALVQMGRAMNAPDHVALWSRLHAIARRFVGFFDGFDALLTPSVAIPPPRIGEFHDPDDPLAEFMRAGTFVPFSQAANVTGQPAVSVPMGIDELGLPVGVQLVGRPGAESTLIRLSAQVSSARPWADRRPPGV